MNAQETLTLVIEAIFWAMVTFMLSQFITGLFVIKRKINSSFTVIQAQTTTLTPSPTAMSFDKPQSVYAPDTYCCEELPDPWTLESEVVKTNSNQIVISSRPLKLLPGIKEIELQPKRTTSRSKKTSQPKSPTARKPRKSHKEVA